MAAPSRLCLCMNLKNHALSQYVNFDFNSMCALGGKAYGFNEDGIHLLYEGDSDGKHFNPIDAFVVFATDLGDSSKKSLRKAELSGEIADDLLLWVKSGNKPGSQVPGPGPGDERTVPLRRDMAGHSFEIGIENVGGSDFSLSAVDIVVTPLGPARMKR